MTKVIKMQFSERLTMTYLLIPVIFLILIDYVVEVWMGSSWQAIVFDSFLEIPRVLLLLYAVYFTWQLFLEEKRRKNLLEKNLSSSRREAAMWQEKTRIFLDEFDKLVTNQFDKWNLSRSERQVALLIMRGKSTKEIAQYRYTSDRTIRNQCRAIYEKGGLSGRSELSAFFLEQILPGMTQTD